MSSVPQQTTQHRWQDVFFAALAVTASCALIIGVPLKSGDLIGGLDIIVALMPFVVLFALPLISREGLREIPYLYFGIAATLFLMWGLISLFAIRGNSAMVLTWVRYFFYFLLIPSIGLIAGNPRRRTVLLIAVACAGVLGAAYGLYQYVNPAVMRESFSIDQEISTRIFSTFDNPNFFGEFLVLTIASTLALFGTLSRKRWYVGILPGAALLLQIGALLLTYTRGSWLALAFGLIIAALVFDVRILVPSFAAILVALPLVPGVLDRLLSLGSVDSSGSFRLGLWKVAGVSISEHPVFGSGIGNFYGAYRDVVTSRPDLNIGYIKFGAHNSYFQLSAETGVIGGVLFLIAILSIIWAGIYLSGRLRQNRPLAFQNAAILAGLAAFAFNALTSNSFQHPRATVYFFIVAGIMVGLGHGFWHRPTVAYTRKPWISPSSAFMRAWQGSILGRILHAMKTGIVNTWNASAICTFLYRTIPDANPFSSSKLVRTVFGKVDE